jgi:hypothetical protein
VSTLPRWRGRRWRHVRRKAETGARPYLDAEVNTIQPPEERETAPSRLVAKSARPGLTSVNR